VRQCSFVRPSQRNREKERGEKEKGEGATLYIECVDKVLLIYIVYPHHVFFLLLKRDDEERGKGGAWSN
jgi:hypothetical protein